MPDMNDYQKYIHISKYARFSDKLKRRETWPETVDRYFSFMFERLKEILGSRTLSQEDLNNFISIKENIQGLSVMPSMRAMMTAGKALARDHIAAYNCAGVAIDHPAVFSEIFFILMNGSGVGFSVERQHIAKLPVIAEEFHNTDTTIIVQDSKEGWAKALKELIALLYNGDVPKWDLSLVRPAGARLKTFGGRSSGPEPLDLLFKRIVSIFKKAEGRKLNSIECHDIVCFEAHAVIVGGVRRAAGLSHSNLTDDRMRRAKSGEFYLTDPQRFLANISVMYTEKPDLDSFLGEFRSMYKSKAGERGMINQEALRHKAVKQCGRDPEEYYVLNPCGEAILRASGGLCNLSEVVIRPGDTKEDIKEKVKLATIIGTIQSTLTNFKFLRKIWKINAEEERLLGVSLTGIMDHPVMCGRGDKEELKQWLTEFAVVAKETNQRWADILQINESKQIGLIKPSGTVSQLVDASSGIHPRYSKLFIRKVTQDNKDPLTKMLKDQGVPHQVKDDKTYFAFPIKAPENAITQGEMSSLEQLELWKIYRDHWCDGNPSQTIYYNDESFPEVQAWVWKNWDSIGGLSFFPVDDSVYEISPYNPCTEEVYNNALAAFPVINWNKLEEYEKEDNTTSSQEVACSGGQCEI
jgi:ribonucleoside-diphosphate reductase alpha chain